MRSFFAFAFGPSYHRRPNGSASEIKIEAAFISEHGRGTISSLSRNLNCSRWRLHRAIFKIGAVLVDASSGELSPNFWQ